MKPPSRDPAATRRQLLEAAFAEIHEHGFRTAGLDAIFSRAGVTKGAVYHHFGSKDQLGRAVFDEVVVPWVEERWIAPVRDAADPLGELIARLRRLPQRTPRERALGCPLGNLVLESPGLDGAFRARVEGLLAAWRAQLAADLRRGKRAGSVRADVAPAETAAFLVAALEGLVGLAKAVGDPKALEQAVAGCIAYLRSLRAG